MQQAGDCLEALTYRMCGAGSSSGMRLKT